MAENELQRTTKRGLPGLSQQRVDRWRLQLQTTKAIEVLNAVITGDKDISPSRLKACEIALKKTVPDLQSTEIKGTGEGMVFAWLPSSPKDITNSTIIEQPGANQENQVNNQVDGEGVKEPQKSQKSAEIVTIDVMKERLS